MPAPIIVPAILAPNEILVKVYKDGTGDYTNFKAAWDANKQDLSTTDSYILFEMKGDLKNTDSFVDATGYTTDSAAGQVIIIQPVVGDETTSIAGASGTVYGTNTYLLICRDQYIYFNSLELDGWTISGHTTTNALATNCLAHDSTDGFDIPTNNTIIYNTAAFVQRKTSNRTTVVSQSSYQPDVLLFNQADPVFTYCAAYTNNTGNSTYNYYQATNPLNDNNAATAGFDAPGATVYVIGESDFVDFDGGNFNIDPSSPLFALGVGAVLGVAPPSGITITPDTVNTSSVSLDPTIAFNATLELSPLAVNTDSVSLDPTLLFSAALELTPLAVNSDSVSLNPSIEFNSTLELTPTEVNSSSISLDPVLQFTSALVLNPNETNSSSIALNPTILFTGLIELNPNAVNSSSVSLDPLIQFSSSLDLSPSTVDSLSIALNPIIEYTSALIINPQEVNSSSISLDPVIEFKSVINLLPETVNSLSVSNNPIIAIGEQQIIGTVTAGFKDDGISVKYKILGITVNFKE